MPRLGASHHTLAPPIPDHPLRGFRTRPVITIERSSRHVVIELGSVGGELRLKAVKNVLWVARRDWSLSSPSAVAPH